MNSLQDGDVFWLIEFLDDVLDTLEPGNLAFRTGLHELGTICSSRKTLPQSHILAPSRLNVAEHPFATRGPCDVYEASLDGSRVWVKRLRVYSMAGSKDVKPFFCQEIVTWRRLSHPNIVPLLGATATPLQSVSAWISGGELPTYLSTHPYADRPGLLFDIANGLNYLHSCNVIHGDLKGTSVLVDDTNRARLTDFGFSRVVSDLGFPAPRTDGPAVRWAAPEVLDMIRPVSEASDAYSFAMVIVEMFTGRVPFHDCIPTTVIVDVASGRRPQRPVDPNFTDDLWDLTERCWFHDPRGRPRISEVILRLQAVFASQPGDCVSQDDTTLGSFRQRQPSFEGPRRQPPQLTITLNNRWRFWKPRETSPPRFPPGRNLSHDAEPEKEGKSTESRCRSYATPNLPRRSSGWFSKFKSLFKRNRYEWL